jgi:YfiH family protein
MEKILISGLYLWQFEQLKKESSLRHFVTDRNTNPDGNEFTLSYSSLPHRSEIKNNRDLLAKAMGIDDEHLYMPSQIHETRILHVKTGTPKTELKDTDALITNEPGLCIAVMSADCVPILLYDKKNKAIAAIHSGWRGTVARILEKTLHKMNDLFGTTGEDLIACIGPSVSQQSYEVGEEVMNAVHESFENSNVLLQPQTDKKAKLDLWKANQLQLDAFGVPVSQVEISDLCTVISNNYFFSARKGDTGRFAAGIMLV